MEAVEQVGELEVGFLEDVVDAKLGGPVELFAVGVGGDDDNGELVPAEVRAEDFQEGDSIHLGHADVEDDGVGGLQKQLAEGFMAIGGESGIDMGLLEKAVDDLAAIGVIIDDQDVRHIEREYRGTSECAYGKFVGVVDSTSLIVGGCQLGRNN